MSDVLWIFYYPHPDSACDAPVITSSSFTGIINNLWAMAKTNVPSLNEQIGNARCKFYIPRDLPFHPPESLLYRSRKWLAEHRDDGQQAYNANWVSELFNVPDLPPDHVHILVVTDELLEGLDFVGDIVELASNKRKKAIKSFRDSFPTPSTGVTSFPGLMRVFREFEDSFHAGRPAKNFGPPVSLFNVHLGLFDYRLRHLDDDSSMADLPLHPLLIQLTHIFMDTSADSYSSESTRTAAIRPVLDWIFPTPLIWEISQSRFGIKPDAVNSVDTPFVVVQVKNEVGIEGDASLQAAMSYAHIATTPLDEEYSSFRSNYPAVLFGIMGNLLEIGVATYTDGPYYSLLFSERLHLGFYAEKNLLRLARAFAATRLVVDDLKKFYSTLPSSDSGSTAHFFPSPLPEPNYYGFMPSLTFLRRLSRSGEIVVLAEDEIARQSGIYLASMARPDAEMGVSSGPSASSSADSPANEVIVKFTAKYHPEAHRRLAAKGFAPTLHACVPVCGGLYMVVMDRVHGELAWDIVKRNELIPHEAYEDIEDAITLLHSDNLVFGDLRTPNIMVVPSGSDSDARCRGILIDYEWVGVHGITRYPASLNDLLKDWESSGITRYGVMDKAHDIVMLNKFKEHCR